MRSEDPAAPSQAPSAMDALRVIDRLEVGPPEVSKRGVSVPYRVLKQSRSDLLELIYRYEEDVFDDRGTDSVNLASVMGAQVALNYGLFAREILFRGRFDADDRRFLRSMAENTAREIYVKKILQPNPFLLGAVTEMPAARPEVFLQAEMRFEETETGPGAGSRSDRRGGRPVARWEADRGRHAILSSGGKDSLLTFGLLREMGREVHPVFVNESGRHWYTALNAYRSMRHSWPLTARVWTNSDRIFNWMLRHLPFVRQDFARIRSDEYAIRLWTVAVFLFGALPVLRKRGIGRIIIGDEYDTTRRLRYKGIRHYDGLFDQSRYFDDALTRYYRGKGWGLSQFSILRPLSEMLIQKILARRYPDLQKDQVSCHAAHLERDRVRPCGNCEKCRRIVGMLVATDEEPSLCGYTKEQVDRCVEALAERGVHQEAEGAGHLSWLLIQKGKIPPPAPGRGPQPHPEVLQLRIDPERSPLEGMPADLREPLLKICLEHAEGAVRRVGRVWVPHDPLTDPALGGPYPFETPAVPASAAAEESRPMGGKNDYLLSEMTWPEARARFRETDLALLPVGAIEQHGPHLPLDVDAWDAEHTALEVAAACKPPRPIVLPLIPYGVSYHHEDFSGTLSVSPETLSRMVYEVGMSAARHGVTKLVIINGHGGNVPTLQFAAQSINRDARIFTCVETGETSARDVAAITETPNDVHAGEAETSTTLATRPELVRTDKARKHVPRFSSQYLNFSSSRSVEWYARTAKISDSGVLGDPSRATREKGEKIWKVTIDHLVAFVEALKGMSLDEIYEKRY